MINLSNRNSIASALFIKWQIPDFSTAYISDFNSPVTINGETYTSIGNLMSVGSITTELQASRNEVSIGLSGVPTGSISTILNQQIKGSTVEIYRGFFNPQTLALLDLSPNNNPVLKFKGIVTNFDISDDVDTDTLTATTSITLTCNSIVEILSNKVSGRRTNPTDFASENSMDKVRALANSNLQFGAPR